jgi:hypothetical protein
VDEGELIRRVAKRQSRRRHVNGRRAEQVVVVCLGESGFALLPRLQNMPTARQPRTDLPTLFADLTSQWCKMLDSSPLLKPKAGAPTLPEVLQQGKKGRPKKRRGSFSVKRAASKTHIRSKKEKKNHRSGLRRRLRRGLLTKVWTCSA